MKNLKQDMEDSLRPEYRRSDFGEMTQGKYADASIEFAELASLLLTCISEEEGLIFLSSSERSPHRPGDWTYEFKSTTQLTLFFWIDGLTSIEETIRGPHFISSQEREDLRLLILNRLRGLKVRSRPLQ